MRGTTTPPSTRAHGHPGPDAAVFTLLLGVLVAAVVSSSWLRSGLQLLVVTAVIVIALIIPAVIQSRRGGDLAPLLVAPTALSAFQNVYLLAVVDDVSPSAFPVVIIINFLIAVGLLVVFLTTRPRTLSRTPAVVRVVLMTLIVMTVWGWASALVFGADLTSALASYRNVVTPMVFVLLGLLAARSTPVGSYVAALLVVAVAAIAFGFFEYTDDAFWIDHGIERLWSLKNIGTGWGGLPSNFFSSELIDGRQARRMVSSFADPVHFGTFLFAAMAAAWWCRQWIIVVLCVVAAWFAVSKGFLLGALVFLAVWARVYANVVVQVLAVAAVAAGAVGFYAFTQDNSTGSTDAHIDGFVAAFRELPAHPLGRGLGNSGVRALLDIGATDSEVGESGIGLVVSQLGLIGVAAWGWFFAAVIRAAWATARSGDRLLTVGLALAFLTNAAFNEVALSPNSAAPYFVLIGLVIGRDRAASALGRQNTTRENSWR